MKKVKSRKAPAKATRRQPGAEFGGAKTKQKALETGAKRAAKPTTPSKPVSTRPAATPSAKIAKAKRRSSADKKSVQGRRGRVEAKQLKKPGNDAAPALNIRELDPLRICGDRTSVVKLFRVDEQLVTGKAAGARQVHLVFNDRHGWYCEHGRSCHAVSAVMRHARIR